MKVEVLLWATGLLCFQGNAQITFSVTDLPSQIGTDYYRSYYNTSLVDVSTLIGPAGGPRRWDFSWPEQPNDTVRRMDVVAPNDGGHGASFPRATYAERVTREPSGAESWDYYSITPGSGRSHFGIYDPTANPTNPLVVFLQPSVELPEPIRFGQTWSWTADYSTLYPSIPQEVEVYLVGQDEADAYGTLVLPGIGEVPTLRVHEIIQEDLYLLDVVHLQTVYFTNYMWMVRGVGVAAQMFRPMSTPNLLSTNDFRRVFEANRVTDRNLISLHLQSGRAVLDWPQKTNTSGYRLEILDSLASTNWQPAADLTTNTWTDSMAATQSQRFFRVFFKP